MIRTAATPVISLDWTDFEADDQTTLVASLKTKHGRSTPLVWVTVQKSALKGVKEPWCLATSLADASGAEVVALYARRFSIEEKFRDIKDLRFGMGLSAMHIAEPDRRDRLLLLGALAGVLLTLLGAAGAAPAPSSSSSPSSVRSSALYKK